VINLQPLAQKSPQSEGFFSGNAIEGSDRRTKDSMSVEHFESADVLKALAA
jgi:hypothetical protein